jgi:3-oxoacyl-[acyl-carrier protein] reductase
MSEPRLDAGIALITGGGGAIGRAVAQRLAHAGAEVVINDIDAEAAEITAAVVRAETARSALVALGDVSVTAEVEAVVAAAVGAHGRLTVLVTCAGSLANAPLTSTTDADWDAVVDVHLGGTFRTARAVVPHLEPGSAMVTVSSGSAWGSNRGQSNYASAKAGIIGLTRTLALELAPGLRVNAVAPGAIESRMTRDTAEQIGITFERYLAETAARVPLARIGQPEDVADVVCFLASPMAAYVTGQVVKVAGGP